MTGESVHNEKLVPPKPLRASHLSGPRSILRSTCCEIIELTLHVEVASIDSSQIQEGSPTMAPCSRGVAAWLGSSPWGAPGARATAVTTETRCFWVSAVPAATSWPGSPNPSATQSYGAIAGLTLGMTHAWLVVDGQLMVGQL